MNITLNINIENINIVWNPQAKEELETAVQEYVQEATPVVIEQKAPHITQALFNKYRLSEKLRGMLGDEAANRFLAGAM